MNHPEQSKIVRLSLAGALLLWTLGFLAPTHAADSREAAVQQARTMSGGNGKVLGVREKNNKTGGLYYEVTVLSNGEVRVYRIPKN